MNDSFGFAACGFRVHIHTFNLVYVMILVLFSVQC